MRSGKKMTLWEVEQFLNRTEWTDEETGDSGNRSLSDPWQEGDIILNTSFIPSILLDTIMLKGGELGVLFNNIATFYRMNYAWWRKWENVFYKWFIAADKEYEPLWDRDGYEIIHDDTKDKGSVSNKGNESKSEKGISSTSNEENTENENSYDKSHKAISDDQGKSQELIRRDIDEEQSGVKTTLIDNPNQDGKGAFDNTQTYGNTVIQNRVSAYDSNILVVHDEQTVKDGVASADGTPAKDTASKHVDRNYGSFTKEQYGDGTNANKFKTNIKDKQNDVDNTDKRKNHLVEAETGGDSSKSGNKNKQHNKTNNAYFLENENESYNTNNRDFDHYMHSYGNWGISQTAQKLLLSEFETRFKTNPYELMAIIYIKEMTDGVWV